MVVMRKYIHNLWSTFDIEFCRFGKSPSGDDHKINIPRKPNPLRRTNFNGFLPLQNRDE